MPKSDTPEGWQGHEVATSACLLDVLTTAATGKEQVPRTHRVLFIACEFWAAARNGSLIDQLSEDPMTQLRSAEAAFIVIGLPKTAECLRLGRVVLRGDPSPGAVRSVAERLELMLAEVEESVDAAIANYARELTGDS
jgi:hypothetical protein